MALKDIYIANHANLIFTKESFIQSANGMNGLTLKMALDAAMNICKIESRRASSHKPALPESISYRASMDPLRQILSKSPLQVNMASDTRQDKPSRRDMSQIGKFIVRANPRAVEGITI